MTRKTRRSRRVAAPFPWFGGKARLMRRLIPHIPNHVRYVSVFGGSGSDIFNKPRSVEEVFNDLHRDIVNFYRVLRDGKARRKLGFMVQNTPHSRQQYAECLKILQSQSGDPLTRAWAFLTASNSGFSGGDPAIATSGGFRISCNRRNWDSCVHHIERVARRFRTVVLEHQAWQDILQRYESADTFFYLDPPYLPSTRRNRRLYSHEMTEQHHVELLERLQLIQGTAMVSGYRSNLYERYFADWRCLEFDVRCTVSGRSSDRTEVIWMNYHKDGTHLSINKGTKE